MGLESIAIQLPQRNVDRRKSFVPVSSKTDGRGLVPDRRQNQERRLRMDGLIQQYKSQIDQLDFEGAKLIAIKFRRDNPILCDQYLANAFFQEIDLLLSDITPDKASLATNEIGNEIDSHMRSSLDKAFELVNRAKEYKVSQINVLRMRVNHARYIFFMHKKYPAVSPAIESAIKLLDDGYCDGYKMVIEAIEKRNQSDVEFHHTIIENMDNELKIQNFENYDNLITNAKNIIIGSNLLGLKYLNKILIKKLSDCLEFAKHNFAMIKTAQEVLEEIEKWRFNVDQELLNKLEYYANKSSAIEQIGAEIQKIFKTQKSFKVRQSLNSNFIGYVSKRSLNVYGKNVNLLELNIAFTKIIDVFRRLGYTNIVDGKDVVDADFALYIYANFLKTGPKV